METQGSEPKPAKSLDEIAAMMAENSLKMRGNAPAPRRPSNTPSEPVAGEQPDGSTITDDTDEQPVADDDTNVDTDADDNTSADDLIDDTEQAEPEPDTAETDEQPDDQPDESELEIDDDTVFQLDDETSVSFADIKKVYTANKDQIELVEKQREATQQALVERQRATEEVNAAKQAAMAVFSHFESLVATPMVSAPNDALKRSDPQRYIQHLDAYNQDQQRIAQNRRDLQEVFNKHVESEKEVQSNLRKQVVERIPELVPQLKSPDENVRREASQDILDAVSAYGFSEAEVNSATDPRLYQMAYEAQQYRKIKAATQSGKTPSTDKKEKATKVSNQTRTLRPRGTTAKQRLSAKAQRVKSVKAKATKSGSVDDVADYIAAKRSTKG